MVQQLEFYMEHEADIEELKAQIRFERRQLQRLIANPDCRDPDHPGCCDCMEDEE